MLNSQKILCFILLSLLFGETNAQKSTASIKVLYAELAQEKSAYYDLDFSFEINGQKIPMDDAFHEFEVKGKDPGFDEIWQDDSLMIHAKFKANHRYVLKLHKSCGYEILPIHAPKRGIFRYEFVNFEEADRNQYFTEHGQGSPEGLRISALCPFAPQRFLIINGDYDPYSIFLEEGMEDEPNIKANAIFAFLHGEKVVVQYDIGNGALSLHLDGYLKREERHTDYIVEIRYEEAD